MKHETYDILARCLAVDDHPHLMEESAFEQAVSAVGDSPELQKDLEEARAFVKAHPVLIECDHMPEDVRKRISKVLKEAHKVNNPAGEQILGPWQIRAQFAWAACLVLLLGAVSVYSSHFMQKQARQKYQVTLAQLPPQDAFRSEVGRLVAGEFSLQTQSDSTAHLVTWLGEQGLNGVQVPASMPEEGVLGCAQFEAPFGKIGVVCFNVEGEIIHIFMTCSRSVGLERPVPPSRFKMRDREALQWSDEENLYLMIPEQEDSDLPEIFL